MSRNSLHTFQWKRSKKPFHVPLRVKLMRRQWAFSDRHRIQGMEIPEDLQIHSDLSYGPYGEWNLLDLYIPKEITAPCPVIISIHGGGYFYGNKLVYQRYCMELAQHGFAVCNFNYRLAPEHRFPAPLEDTNAVFNWLYDHAQEYGLDPQQFCLIGDSAGAQLASHYAALWADPSYASLLGLRVPEVRLAAISLSCGMYDLPKRIQKDSLLMKDYLGSDPQRWGEVLDVFSHIRENYPPAYVFSAQHDFLLEECQPMAQLLAERGVSVESKIYSLPDGQKLGHVFQLDHRKPIAHEANEDQIRFLKRFLKTEG